MIENTKNLEMSYDEVPYMSKTFYATQPNKLKSSLKLLDFETPEVETARVLEIGCSFGGNIIPFALANPKSKVIGLDLSKVQVDEGNKLIDSLGVDNIKLYHKDILDYKGEFGEFDYIICHGVYSWVPEEVQNAILDVIKKSLSKNGAAVISYNVYPGWKNMEIAKDIMTFRDKYLSKKGVEITNENRVSFGKGAIEFILNHSQQNDRVKNAIKSLMTKDDYYILHEYFEMYNKPLYIYDFAEKLQEFGLAHVVDSNYTKSFPILDEEVEKKINNECGEDYIAKEQYYDYINDCQFRSSIITHADNLKNINISKDIKISNLKELFYRGRYFKNENGNYSFSNEIEVTNDNRLEEILELLNNIYPETLSLDEIIEKLNNKIELREVATTILNLIYSQNIEVFNKKIVFVSQEKLNILPRYRKYLEYFVNTSQPIISLASINGLTYDINTIKLETPIMLLFDGTRTDEDIYKILEEKMKNKEIVVQGTDEESIKSNLIIFISGLRNFIEENFFYIER